MLLSPTVRLGTRPSSGDLELMDLPPSLPMSASSSSRPFRRGRCQPPPRARLAAPPLPVAARVWSPVPGSPPSHRLSFPRATPRASQYPASCGRVPAYGRRRRAADRLRGRVPTGGRLRLVARLLRLPVRRLGHRPRRLPLARRGVRRARDRARARRRPPRSLRCVAPDREGAGTCGRHAGSDLSVSRAEFPAWLACELSAQSPQCREALCQA